MIYIILPVYNRKELTRNCLFSLKQQDMSEYCLVVVDDGSTDGTSQMIQNEFPEIILLHGDGSLWWAGAINMGIRYALSRCLPEDYILTLNDDLIVPTDYLSNLLRSAELHPETIIGSLETTMDEPDVIKSGGILINWMTAKSKVLNRGKRLEQFPKDYTINVSSLTGRGTLFKCSLIRKVGFYDDVHIKQCADTELPLRAHLKYGYPLLLSYDAKVISFTGNKMNINTKKYYTISDFGDYFFSIRSHFNLENRFWIALNIAPNKVWFVRYLTLSVLRTIGRFVLRLRLQNNI